MLLRSYATVAMRNLARHRLYALINILGLAVALTAALLIGLFVRHELSYDRFWPAGERTYRVTADITVAGHPMEPSAATQMPLAGLLREQLAEVEAAARAGRYRVVFGEGDATLTEIVTAADPQFLDLFPLEFQSGDRATALARPDGIVLSAEFARRLFGDADPVGRGVTLDGEHAYTVTGVLAEQEAPSFLKPRAIIAMDGKASLLKRYDDAWNMTVVQTFVRLRPGTDPAALLPRLRQAVERMRPADVDTGGTVVYDLQPVPDIHLTSVRFRETADRGDALVVTGLTVVALLILAIAAINFTNLATARALGRAKEIGVRKALGARRAQIVAQFLGEAVVLSLVALALATAAAELLLPRFAAFVGRPLALDWTADPVLTFGSVAVAAAVGLAGGLYPAFRLSAFDPARVLKGEREAIGGVGVRTLLVVFQFAISISLMVATAVVYAQLAYLRSVPLGYERQGLMVLAGLGQAPESAARALLDEVRGLPGVVAAARSSDIPTQVPENYMDVRVPGAPAATPLGTFGVDAGFVETYGLTLLAGRALDAARATDREPSEAEIARQGGRPEVSLMLNRSAARALGFASPEAAVDQRLTGSGTVDWRIVGVLEDARLGSAREEVKATLFYAPADPFNFLTVRLAPGQVAAKAERVRGAWARLVPGLPVRSSFIEDRYEGLYASEARQGTLFATFAGLAIAIACLGLFGLAAFAAEARTKEIGLRKVLGATVADIVRLLVWQFSKPVLLANLLAWPLAYLVMSDWLAGFVYRIDLSPAFFLAASIAALAIAWVTVAGHAARVAVQRPVLALRHD
ncbi:MAG TPA: ABC transporter permease [Azospirillaceae bacterium]|nr:ABC transporter permease [Azospirillaceae bacterium]